MNTHYHMRSNSLNILTMLNKFWNGKIISLPFVIGILSGRIFSKICDYIATISARANLGKCHRSVRIISSFSYRYPSRIEVGERVIIGRNVEITSEINNDRKMKIEQDVSIGYNCHIDFTGGIILKKRVVISHDVIILTHDHGYDSHSVPICKELVIEENVTVGYGSIILHNCNYIGKNAWVGVGSVVTKDVPDNAIVGGIPAKIIKYRDDV